MPTINYVDKSILQSYENSLGTIKASLVVVLNENSVVVIQRKLMFTAI